MWPTGGSTARYQEYRRTPCRARHRSVAGVGTASSAARTPHQSPSLDVIPGPEVVTTAQPETLPEPRAAGRAPSVGTPWRPAKGDTAAPFVGRSEQFDFLRQWLAESLSGTPRVVVLSGAAGVGKSRLVTELIAELVLAGIHPYAGRCLEDSQIPLLALAAVLDALGVDIRALADAATHLTRRARRSPRGGRRRRSGADGGSGRSARAARARGHAVVRSRDHCVRGTRRRDVAEEATFRHLPVMLLITARPDVSPRAAIPTTSAGERQPVDAARRARRARCVRAPRSQTGARPSEALLHLLFERPVELLEVDQLVGRLGRAGALEARVPARRTLRSPAFPARRTTTPVLPALAEDAAVGHDARVAARWSYWDAARRVRPRAGRVRVILDETPDVRLLEDDGTRRFRRRSRVARWSAASPAVGDSGCTPRSCTVRESGLRDPTRIGGDRGADGPAGAEATRRCCAQPRGRRRRGPRPRHVERRDAVLRGRVRTDSLDDIETSERGAPRLPRTTATTRGSQSRRSCCQLGRRG